MAGWNARGPDVRWWHRPLFWRCGLCAGTGRVWLWDFRLEREEQRVVPCLCLNQVRRGFWPEVPPWWAPMTVAAIVWWIVDWAANWGMRSEAIVIALLVYSMGAQTGWSRRQEVEMARRAKRETTAAVKEA